MKKSGLAGLLSVCAVAGLATMATVTGNQDAPQAGAGAPTAEEMQAMMEGMQDWMKAMKPSEHHAKLEPLVGNWSTTTKMWWEGPGTPPMETHGTSVVKWVLGKRFLQEEHHGEMLMPDATGNMKSVPYEGIGLTGYDNNRNLYTGYWVSNMGTEPLIYNGAVDPSGKIFRMYGVMDEPILGVTGRMVKYVTRIINNDKHVFEIYDLHAGDDYKVVEITYVRK